MSIQDDLKKEGILLTKMQKAQIRARVMELKAKRHKLEMVIKSFVQAHRNPTTGKWDERGNKEQFKRLMIRRSTYHTRLFRIQGERKAPEYDPY